MAEIRLKEKYNKEVSKELTKTFGYTNAMSVPTVTKIKVNVGLGEALTNSKAIDSMSEALERITGQKPVVAKARKAISNFKLREGDKIGVSVTLRGDRMWFFLDKLVSIVLPRVRDFRGVPYTSFDGNGNYTLGIKEHTVFPEIDPNKVDKIRGLAVTVVTSAKTNEEGYELLKLLGMPFKKKNN